MIRVPSKYYHEYRSVAWRHAGSWVQAVLCSQIRKKMPLAGKAAPGLCSFQSCMPFPAKSVTRAMGMTQAWAGNACQVVDAHQKVAIKVVP